MKVKLPGWCQILDEILECSDNKDSVALNRRFGKGRGREEKMLFKKEADT